jgi:hypothetical protein
MEWIKCSERLPKEYEYVLLYAEPKEIWKQDNWNRTPLIFVGCRSGNYYDSAHGDGYQPFAFEEITHWMAIPPKPDELR